MPDSDTIDFIAAQQRFSRANAVLSLNDDPERAARAAELAEATGADPSIVYGDLDNWEAQHKAGLTSQIVDGNPRLRAYADAAPLNAKISNDDWGALDTVSQALDGISQALRGSTIKETVAEKLAEGQPQGPSLLISNSFEQAFSEAFDWEGFKQDYRNLVNYFDNPAWKAIAVNPVLSAPALTMRAGGGLFSGVSAAIGKSYALTTGDEAGGARLARDVGQLIQVAMSGQAGIHVPPEFAAISRSIRAGEPFLRVGKEPPVGIDPLIDQAKALRNAEDLDALDAVLKETQQSATRERSPEAFADFIRQHTDAKIGVNADMIRALYGDKAPEQGDNLLGWVPDLAQKLEAAEATGGDVEIALADWLAKVDPQVSKALRDGVRVREDGVSAIEATESVDRQKVAAEQSAKLDAQIGELSTNVETLQTSENALTEQIQAALAIDDQATVKSLLVVHDEVRAERIRSKAILEKLQEKQAEAGFELYHGSPHEFDAFDIGKIGTGEGSQSFGHGLYFAESPEVGKDYAEKLGGGKGSLYRVRIKARTEQFLDWDKPLAEQPLEVHSLFHSLGLSDNTVPFIENGRDLYYAIEGELRTRERKRDELASEQEIRTRVAEKMAKAGIPGIRFLDQKSRVPPTAEAIQAQREHIADLESAIAQGDTSAYVREAIAEGKQILAQMERGPTRNYVLFTHDLIEILDRNGEAVQSLRQAARLDQTLPQPPPAEGPQPAGPEAIQAIEERLQAALETDDLTIASELLRQLRQERESAGEGEQQVKETQAQQPFPQKPGWMSADQYARYLKLIDKRNAEDAAAAQKRAEKEIRRRQSAEWKANANEVRKEVAAEIDSRPDMQADEFFRVGSIGGVKLETGIPKLGREFLTPEEIASLPERYTRDGGLNPDDVAQLFGYADGKAMLADLSAITQARENSGRNYSAWRRGVIEAETAKRMEERYGKLDENVLAEAKEQVLSETQMDLLHEDVLAMGLKAGAQFPISRGEFEAWVKGKFDETRTGEVKSDRFLRDAGTAGRRVEDALLRGDFAEAFRQRQRQYISVLLAKEALQFEKDVAKVEKIAKRFAKTEVKAVAPEYTAGIQLLLRQAGYKGKLSIPEIAEGLAFHGFDDLGSLVDRSLSDGWEPQVADWLRAANKPVDEMTTAEFREFKDAVTSLQHIGREARKIEIAGEKVEWDAFRQDVLGHIRQLPVRAREGQGRWLYEMDASLTRMEEIIKDLDLREELGPLYRAVIVPMMLSKAKEFDLVSALAKHFRDTKKEFGRKWQRTLGDTIPQDFIIDPYTQLPYDLTRENLIQIMLNWGNRSNIEKFTLGHASLALGKKATKEQAAAFEAQVKALIDTHATAEDWRFVQRMWQPFREWQPMTDTVSRNVSGVVPKWIAPEAIDTPHGQQEGGYWPVKYDRLGSNMTVIEDRQDSNALFGPRYFRAATAKSHLKERTGYVDFVDISTSLEQAAGTMQQTMHDIAFRDSLVQANRVFQDKEIRAAIRKHYGVEYEAQLMPWLKRIANKNVADERAIKWYNDWQRRVRVNMIGHVLPLNLRVILSPDIGVPDPVAWTAFEANRSANVALAMEKSQEIRHLVYNMDRDFREQLEQATTKKGFASFQAKAVEWGFAPMMRMSQEFRMSTFVDQYQKALARGLSEFDAITVADSFVRERHGAASVVDLPAIMQSSETMKSLTMFYGYFNSMYNWQRQLPGNLRRGEWKNFAVNGLGSVVVGAAFGAALFNQAHEKDSWFYTIAKALALQPLSTIPIVRDAANYWLEGQQPRTPTVGLLNALSAMYTDVKRKVEHKPMKRPIQNLANVIGFAGGLPLAQLGRTAEFLNDVRTHQQRPRNIFEWARGIISGEAKLHK